MFFLISLFTLSKKQKMKEKFIVEATDGLETIATAASRGIFFFIEKKLKGWKFNHPDTPTLQTELKIFEVTEPETFIKTFEDLLPVSSPPEIDRQVVTQAQFVRCCLKYRKVLCREKQIVAFLIKRKSLILRRTKYRVLIVGTEGKGLGVLSRRPGSRFDTSQYRYYFAVPILGIES